MFPRSCSALAVALALFNLAPAHAEVRVTPDGDVVHVVIDGQPFTDFVLRGGDAMKPYLHPLRSATGQIVSRHFPMETVAGEPTDHPHQRGLWFAHEKVNGIDFWNNEATYKTPNRGRIEVAKIDETKSGAEAGSIKASLNWLDPNGVKLLDESREMIFRAAPGLRIVDLDIQLTAATKVTFGDAKDGALGLRLAPVLQETAAGHGSDSKLQATGTIASSNGQTHEKEVWGKPADWVDYSGTLEGKPVGIAIFDHPGNTRRARWHVRAYGLFAANPFGLAVFTGDKSQDGSLTLEPGGKLRLRYRVIIHDGDKAAANLPKLWEEYLRQSK